MTSTEGWDIKSCNSCRASSNDNFKQVAYLKSSGLAIYIYDVKSKQKRRYDECSSSNIILHNTSNKDLKRYDYIMELCQYRTKCLKCKMLIQRVRNAIDEISTINKNAVIGVCNFCKRWQQKHKCQRCQYIVGKFLHNKISQSAHHEEQLRLCLLKLQNILLSLLGENLICKHKKYLGDESKTKFSKLLNVLTSPAPMRQPEIDEFPELFDLKETGLDISERKNIIEDLVNQFEKKMVKSAELDRSSSSGSVSQCICKYFGKSESYGDTNVTSVTEKKASLYQLPVMQEDENKAKIECIAKIQEKDKVEYKDRFEYKAKTEDKAKVECIAKIQEKDKVEYKDRFEYKAKTEDKAKVECIAKIQEKDKVEYKDRFEYKAKTEDKAKVEYKPKIDKAKMEDKSKIIITSDENQKQGNIKQKSIKSGKRSIVKSFKKTEPDYTDHKLYETEINTKGNTEPNGINVPKDMDKANKQRKNSDDRLILQLLKKQERERKEAIRLKNLKMPSLPPIKDLPILKKKTIHKTEKLDAESSETILECKDNRSYTVTETIRGTKIIHTDSHIHHTKERFQLPMLFDIKVELTPPMKEQSESFLPPSGEEGKNKKHGKEEQKQRIGSGIIRYQLSNREFIDKGWTKLPATKIMRRMNIYKMLPASKVFDWFKLFKKDKVLFYDSGEKLAEIYDSGSGRWYYKNGKVAMDVHKEKDDDTVDRYILYSCVENTATCNNEPITILACFDCLGNGVVYDHYGNVRLKYNQSEGVVLDKKIAPPGRWKWHTLNDPPVLQQVFIDTYDTNVESQFDDVSSAMLKKANQDMVGIELENFLKEKAHKLMQKFKPFQIRMKVLKINNLFSLRIIDQANIYLLFRCDRVSMRINIGMLLKNDEIIDTEVAEVSDVSTPYDIYPPKSQSLINIQNTLNNIRNYYSSSKRHK